MGMPLPRLLSLQVAEPKVLQTEHGPLRTALLKQGVEGAIELRSRGLAGDGCADLTFHGHIDQALCVYPSEHYAWWQSLLKWSPELLVPGSFGENFTVEGMLEDSVQVEDRYRVGSAVVQVSKPRRPCRTLNKVWGDAYMAARMGRHGRTGWYMQVVSAGIVEAGQRFHLLERNPQALTIAEAWKSMDKYADL